MATTIHIYGEKATISSKNKLLMYPKKEVASMVSIPLIISLIFCGKLVPPKISESLDI